MTSEETVIACLLANTYNEREKRWSVNLSDVPFLRAEHFSNELLGRLFTIFQNANEKGRVENFVSIFEELGDIEGIPQDDIQNYVKDLYRSYVTTVQFVPCAKKVYKDWRKRNAIALINHTNFSFENFDDELSEVIDELTALRTFSEEESGQSLADLAELYANSYPKDEASMGVMTGISELDDILGGTQGGDLCFIGARPSAGKSAFANQIALHFESCKKKVGFFNLEMQKDAVYERFLAHQSKVSLSAIRGRRGTSIWEEEELENANRELRKIKNLIFYTGTFTASKIRQIVERDKLEVVVIDYLQLLKTDGRYSNRTSEVGAISHAIKAIAMDFNIPIFPLVQLNRAVELRDNKEPTLADIRESGDIEQDASQVVFLWTVPNPADKNDTSNKMCRVAKNRNGALDEVPLKFDGMCMNFTCASKPKDGGFKSPKEQYDGHHSKPFKEDQMTLDDMPFIEGGRT